MASGPNGRQGLHGILRCWDEDPIRSEKCFLQRFPPLRDDSLTGQRHLGGHRWPFKFLPNPPNLPCQGGKENPPVRGDLGGYGLGFSSSPSFFSLNSASRVDPESAEEFFTLEFEPRFFDRSIIFVL